MQNASVQTYTGDFGYNDIDGAAVIAELRLNHIWTTINKLQLNQRILKT